MRLSSGFSEVLIFFLLPIAFSCASAPPALSPADSFRLEGSIRVEGDQPFDRVIVLSDTQGIRWSLDPGDLESELSLLDGYRVILDCRGIPTGGELDALVEGYRLVPPEGMIAVLGRFHARESGISLITENDRYTIEGPLTSVLESFDGHRAWVWGKAGADGSIDISGYEVLGPVLD
jgi:hypothetical protein